MENTDKKITRREKVEIAILILLVIAIASFIITIIVLVKNVDEIKSTPIDYGIDHSDIVMCTCFNQQNEFRDFYGTTEEIRGDGPRGST